jgi:EAL domain-containing protein (putative c-di-GMP-specific phosphodiesterase class I)
MEGHEPPASAPVAERLADALEHQTVGFHYQPMLELEPARDARRAGAKTLRDHVVAVEALLRWQEMSGSISPAEVIALAENIGLIERIGDWALEEACRQSAAWNDAGLELPVAVNLSLRQLWQPELAERMTAAVRSSGVDSSRLIAEITEAAALADVARSKRIMTELRGRGFRLTIDDFGTYSPSLDSLREMPIDVLKIDRSVVSKVPEDTIASIMVTAVVEAAHNRDIRTVAVGIETDEQLDFLVERGCALGQGYLFSRPVPPAEIEAL